MIEPLKQLQIALCGGPALPYPRDQPVVSRPYIRSGTRRSVGSPGLLGLTGGMERSPHRQRRRTSAEDGRFRSTVGDGAPGRIRTHDPQIRSLVLYPAELPVPREGAQPMHHEAQRQAILTRTAFRRHTHPISSPWLPSNY